MEDEPRPANLDRREEVKGAIRAHDVAARRELTAAAGRHVDGVALPRTETRAEGVEPGGLEPEPVTGRVLSLCGGELGVVRDSVLDAREHLDRSDDCRRHDRGEEDRGGDDPQPNRRTPRRTRIALKPSLHVIFFPSA